MHARRLSAIFVLMLALGLAACGESKDPGAEPPTTAPPDTTVTEKQQTNPEP